MKYLSFESEGHPVASIKSNNRRVKNKIIHLDDKKKSIHGFNELKLSGDDSFQLLPNDKIERAIHYICGSSGSGKTYWIKLFLIEYKKTFPKNDIYVFSPFPEEDKSFEGVKVNYMKIDEDLLNDSLTSEDFKNSMIVFDDIEAISNRTLRKDVLRLMDDVLTTGRHYNVSACVVFHEATNGQPTKKILNESHSISFFPRTLSGRSMKYLCDSYLGLEKDEIKRIKKLKTRAVTVVKGYPKVIVSDKEMFCLGCDNDSSSDSDNSSSSDDQRYTRKKQNSKYKIK